ncbi:hypothetical protein FB451DRAFT_451823 [Mycena latifolia]|nr:hypothetical protein FB451DRAFT_451823 [Mycena latifolia]
MPPLTRQRTLESLHSWWSDTNPPSPTINLHTATKPLIRLMYPRQASDMPPQTRQRTLESLLSWWSDSNLPGATINLHAASKPLMRFLYHWQASDFVRRNRGVPLSPETLEIYWSYVSWKYVSLSTKNMILADLAQRTKSANEARVVIDSNILGNISQLWKLAPAILLNLIRHDRRAAVAICESLGALLRDSSREDQATGLHILTQITSNGIRNGAEAAVEARLLDSVNVARLLESRRFTVQQDTCHVLGELAKHPSTASAVLDLKPCGRLVALLRDSHVAQSAADALIHIASTPNGAAAVVAAKVLEHAEDWLVLPSWARAFMCKLLANLAKHECTAGAVLDIKPCELLVTLLSQMDLSLVGDSDLAECAFKALISIAKALDGAEAAVAANVPDYAAKHLASPFTGRRYRISPCRLVEKLARHESTRQAITRVVPRELLVALLSDRDDDLSESAQRALWAFDGYSW